MDNSLADLELQRRIQITSLLQHGGWRIYCEKLNDLKEAYRAELAQILANEVNDTKLALLNTSLGKLKALEAVLAVAEELKEEITPDEEMSEV